MTYFRNKTDWLVSCKSLKLQYNQCEIKLTAYVDAQQHQHDEQWDCHTIGQYKLYLIIIPEEGYFFKNIDLAKFSIHK